MINRPIIIASRGSKLAMYQSEKVRDELQKNFPWKTFLIEIVRTKGDKVLDVSLSKIGDRDLFSKELEILLLENKADLAVHSLKDIPTDLPAGLTIGAVLKRGEVRDALVSVNGKKLAELDESDIVATSSLRRRAQFMNINSKPSIIDIRGNVDTRIQKMKDGYCTAMIMAAAGLQRLGYDDLIKELIDPLTILPAVSQGAIAIEIREDDHEMASLIKAINHVQTFTAVTAERTFLRTLEGGCQTPIGCFSEISNEKFRITGIVLNLDGSGLIKQTLEGLPADAEKTAFLLAKDLIGKGAGEMIFKIRTSIKNEP
jgi:hydroxymethylbilane synthase